MSPQPITTTALIASYIGFGLTAEKMSNASLISTIKPMVNVIVSRSLRFVARIILVGVSGKRNGQLIVVTISQGERPVSFMGLFST